MDRFTVKYKCICTECNYFFYASKSLAHDMGFIELGSVTCPKCKTFFNATLCEEKKEMILTKWEVFVEEFLHREVN